MESELDRTEDKLQEVSHRLELCEKARDDAELNLRSLENAEQSNFDRLDYQEKALKDAQQIANESDRKYEGMKLRVSFSAHFRSQFMVLIGCPGKDHKY